MFFKIFRGQVEQRTTSLTTQDAFNLWTMTKQRYFMIDQLMHAANFTHDIDFRYLIHQYIEAFQKDLKILEQELEKYSLLSPTPNLAGVNTQGNFEVEKDELTANLLLLFLQINATQLIESFKASVTNDSIRNTFYKIAKGSISSLDEYIGYLKLKNWLETPPLYPFVPDYIQEKVAANEIYHLWNHLLIRYTNIHQTSLFQKFATDADLQMLLSTGCKALKRQAKNLENILLRFGVTLPKNYPNVTIEPAFSEIVEDRYIFNAVYLGMQNAYSIHGAAIRECLVNDQVRTVFINLLFEELALLNDFIKYGKIKGWLPLPPVYQAP